MIYLYNDEEIDNVVIGTNNIGLLQEYDSVLDGLMSVVLNSEEGYVVFNTLGHLPFSKLYVVSNKCLSNSIKEIYKHLNSDVLIDVDSLGISGYELAMDINYISYCFDFFKSKKENRIKTYFMNVVDQEEITAANNMSLSIDTARDLVNFPHNYLNSHEFVNYIQKMILRLNDYRVSLNILMGKECEELGMGAFLGVNKGSSQDARLVTIHFKNSSSAPIGIVGKGITFDTGGYSLKAKDSMMSMKSDMAGAATALAVLEACVRLDINCNLIICLPLTDNMINSDSIVVDDILTAMNGKTIEIKSTDAEGRLILADALCYTERLGVKKIIDIATLTGACVVALGDEYSGVFGNDQRMINDFINVSKKTNEGFWQLPISVGMINRVKDSKVADLVNSTGRMMGASGAAAFLLQFISNGTSWMHLDIAGTAFKDSMATGATIKTLVEYIKYYC